MPPPDGSEHRPDDELNNTKSDRKRTKPSPSTFDIRPPVNLDMLRSMSTVIPPTNAKKKKKKIPEKQQILKDMVFYYMPPNDNLLCRKIKIQAAVELGATWAQSWLDGITHVIAEDWLYYPDVMSHLKIDIWPSNLILVNDRYTWDCTRFKRVLDPKSSYYQVEGWPRVEELSPPQSAETRFVNRDETRPLDRDLENETYKTPKLSSPGDTVDRKRDETLASLDSETETRNKRPKLSDSGDTLDDMIIIARGMQGLPLNDDEDENENPRPQSGDEDTDSEEEARRAKARKSLKKKKETGTRGQESFACMKGPENNPNAGTIEVLEEMAYYYIRMQDQWRPIAYRKAIATLRRQTTKINTYEEAIVLPAIGERLALKIEEIVATNRLQRLENAKSELNDQVLQTFMKIYGVGVSQAWKWVQQGYKTLQDLLDHAHLTKNQKLGIERYDDLQTRIPRDEVTALGNIVKDRAAKIDPEVKVIICGSYRRGAATCGDIDCLLTKPGTKTSRDLLPFLNELVFDLTMARFLVAALAVPSEGSGSKWHGCCVLRGAEKPIWRRIDLLLVPETELGAAILYFTGDDIFNRSMRLLASKKGWRLNNRDLYKNVMRGPGRAKMNEGELIEGRDEKRIFELLGVPWREPEDRIYH